MQIDIVKKLIYKYRLIFVVVFFLIFPLVLYWSELISPKIMIEGDGYLVLSRTVFEKNALLKGEMPFWNSYSVLGTPYIADPGNGFFYPLKLLSLLLPIPLYSKVYFLLSLSLGGIFSFLFIREAVKNDWVAFISGAVFTVGIIIGGYRKEHVMVYSTLIWVPLIIFFILRYIHTINRKYLVFTAAIMAIQFFAGFPQDCFYTYMIAFSLLIYLSIKEKLRFWRILTDLLITGIFLIAFSSIQLIPSIDFIMSSGRGTSEQFGLFSTHPGIILMSVFPYIFGDIYNPLGLMNSAEISIELYIGIIPFIYSLYSLRYHWADKLVRYFVIVSFICYIYSSCMHIPYIGELLIRIPIINMFGIPSRTLFIIVISGLLCFSKGIIDIFDESCQKRIIRHSALMAIILCIAAFIAMAVTLAPQASELKGYYKVNWFNVFGISILFALLNMIIVCINIFMRKYTKSIYAIAPYFIIAILCIFSVSDIWRFSKVHTESDYDKVTSTVETQKLISLPNIYNSRVTTLYDFSTSYYGSLYSRSGLIDNRGMINDINNINGWMEFDDRKVNVMLNKIESRDSGGVTRLIGERNDIISMLAIRYILCPYNANMPKEIPQKKEKVLLSKEETIKIAGDEKLFAQYYPIEIVNNRYYKIDFEITTSEPLDINTFYVDLFSSTKYDRYELQKNIEIVPGTRKYTIFLYTDNFVIPEEQVYARIITVTKSDLILKNVNVSLMEDSNMSPKYRPVERTDDYLIYENLNAHSMIYISEKVVGINDNQDIVNNVLRYPNMDRISYVQDCMNIDSCGSISDIKKTTNSIEAIVNTEMGAFINHSQSYRLGWKVYVDGKETKLYCVNGIIQGAIVPPGKHVIQFKYIPSSFYYATVISMFGIIIAYIYVTLLKRRIG